MILCQISDLHIKPERKLAYGVVDTATMLERCIAQIGRLPQRPDAVIATGDLVDGGTPAEYSLLRDLLSPLTMPLYLMPGNHDERRAMRQVFDDHLYLQSTSAFIQYVINDFPLRVIALDTVIPGQSRRDAVRRAVDVARARARRVRQTHGSRIASSTVRHWHRPYGPDSAGLIDQA